MNTPPDPWRDDILALVRHHLGPREYVSVAEARDIVHVLLLAAAPYLDPVKLARLQEAVERILSRLTDTSGDTLQ
jgi:hypothetical protein